MVVDFAKKYYDGNDSWSWVGDEIGGCLNIGDEYHNLDSIVTVMRIKPTVDEFFNYYWYVLDCHEHDKSPYKLEYWLSLEREN